jgi:hypothetical protein
MPAVPPRIGTYSAPRCCSAGHGRRSRTEDQAHAGCLAQKRAALGIAAALGRGRPKTECE